MTTRDGVLVTWLARNNDPYERDRSGEPRVDESGECIRGPTLALLFDEDSPYTERVGRVVMFVREEPVSLARAEATRDEIQRFDSRIQMDLVRWKGTDPTDHAEIFEFVREQLPLVRDLHPGRPLLIHASPGTPSMHTIWVLMASTGFVRPPFELLRSFRKDERYGRPAVVPIDFSLDTFYRRYQVSRPAEVSAPDQDVVWDPARFRSASLTRVFEEATSIARLHAPVLILGERGTGKTTLANWIRMNSPFRREALDDHWPAVACGQYQETTISSELFGHVKGAFTGAEKDRDGLLLRANGDTLFLDEIGDLSRDAQRRLIKAIEEARFQPMGTADWQTSSFRLIAATNVPLDELRKRLDPDFFDRIALLRIRVPPLRELEEDIPWLWTDVLARVERRAGLSLEWSQALTSRVIQFLQGHPLRGNLRDLQAIAWRALARWSDRDPTEAELTAWLPSALDAEVTATNGDLARDVAARFAAGEPIDDLVPDGAPLPTRQIQKSLQQWLSEEIRRVARRRGVSQDTLVDVTPKTLREWLRQQD